MPRIARRLAESGIYHVMLRGVNRDLIHLEDEDFGRFLVALARAKTLSGCSVFAYCLMPNHAHLLLQTGAEPIGEVVKRFGVSYVGWFNRKYARVGHLFQDRFLSAAVEDDLYLSAVLRYIWRNPVVAGMVEDPFAYPWNSCSRHRPPGLVDGAALRRLLPPISLAELARSQAPASEPDVGFEAMSRPGANHVSDLVVAASGARTAAEFRNLDPATQRRVIAELRTRQITYRAIAAATGLPLTRVHRLHLSGAPTD